MMKSRYLAMLMGIAIILLLSPSVYSGALEKYQVPPIQQSVPDEAQQRSQPIRPVPDLPVYQNFRSYVRSLPNEQLEGLIATYSTQKQRAVESGDWSQATYYNNLINILLNERSRR